MKDKRNCNSNMNYPIYGGQMVVPPMGYPAMPNMMGMPIQGGVSSNTFEQQLNNIEQQINLLEKRVTRLENLSNNSTTNYNKYSDSNYYMV